MAQKRLLNSKTLFYFTFSKGCRAPWDYVTNNPSQDDIPKIKFIRTNQNNEPEFIDALKFGVFASMDLPPLFPYMEADDEYIEDGGVVDNLPIFICYDAGMRSPFLYCP